MIVEVKKVPGRGRKRRKIIVFGCDGCGIIYERNFHGAALRREFHFHTKTCWHAASKRSSGSVYYDSRREDFMQWSAKTKETIEKLYGVENISQLDEIKQRKEETCLKNHGVRNPLQSKEIRELGKQTSLEKYGTEHPMQSDIVQQKMKNTNVGRYGVENVFQAESIKQKCVITLLERYGVRHNSQMPAYRESYKATCNVRYGVEHYSKTYEFVKRCKVTSLEKYGVEHYNQSAEYRERASRTRESNKDCPRAKIDWDVAAKKRHETMKRNGTYRNRMTRPERLLGEYLYGQFGRENVESQYFVHRWPIDFYVKSVNVYVQMDGVYWHGLDRSIDVIKQFKSPRDRVIYRKSQIDVEQNEWFSECGLKLVRITDKEVLAQNFDKLLELKNA